MNVSAVPATVVVKAPEVPVFKAPDKTPEVQNGAAADGTRTPKPTQVAPLPPGRERGSTSWPEPIPGRRHPPCAQLRTGAGDPVFQRRQR